jgi:carbon storage regulator
MLALSRRIGDEIVIDGRIVVRVIEIQRNKVKLAIDAPKDIEIMRREIIDRKPKGKA